MDRNTLLKKLTTLDFVAVDLALFLDTHPNCTRAIEHYNQVVREADKLREEYQKKYGPLYSYRCESDDSFTWIEEPWPWEKKFNFSLSKEGN